MTSITRIPVIALVGRSKSGKTTLMEKLIPELKQRGYRVGTVKHHAHPKFEIDYEGKDSWRHAQAGSDHVVIAAPDKIASIRRLEQEMTVEEIVNTMTDVDIVVTEGYWRSTLPKVEVLRAACSSELLSNPDEILGLVTDIEGDHYEVPHFTLNDVAGLADFIERVIIRPYASAEAGDA